MGVLNINQFYSKEQVRINKDYELTPQSEWVYGEKEMILFARRYLAYWKEANGVTTKKRKVLHKHIVGQQSELLINFLIELNDKGLINNHDFDYEKEAKKFAKKLINCG